MTLRNIQPEDRIGVDDEERLDKHEKRLGLPPGSLRFVTRAEMKVLYAEAARRWFPESPGCAQLHHQPCFICQRNTGAQGD